MGDVVDLNPACISVAIVQSGRLLQPRQSYRAAVSLVGVPPVSERRKHAGRFRDETKLFPKKAGTEMTVFAMFMDWKSGWTVFD